MRGAETGGGGGTRRLVWRADPADAAPTSHSLFVARRELHVSTDDPMMASMAGRYAAALFELAKDQRQLAEVERDLVSLPAMLDASEDLRRLVRSPVISADDQAKALTALPRQGRHLRAHRQLPQADRQQPAPVRRRRHAEELPRAARPRARRGQRRRRLGACADARADAAAVRHVANARSARTCRSIRASTRRLLGGLIVKVGSRMIDSSLRTKLNNLKVAMKGIA